MTPPIFAGDFVEPGEKVEEVKAGGMVVVGGRVGRKPQKVRFVFSRLREKGGRVRSVWAGFLSLSLFGLDLP